MRKQADIIARVLVLTRQEPLEAGRCVREDEFKRRIT